MSEKGVIKRAVCAALAMAMLALTGCGEKKEPPVAEGVPLSAASYPERPVYPKSDDGWSYDEAAYKAWYESVGERRLTNEELGALEGAWERLLPALLSGGEGENMVCSPANVYVALSMLAECAGGRSRQQLTGLLGAEDIDGQRALTKRLWEALYNSDGTYGAVLANSLWLRSADEGEYDTSVLETLARDYYASSFAGEMGSAGFDKLLRDWLNGQTGGLLEDEIGGIGLQKNTVLALASTAYFKDRWGSFFDADMTEKDIFHGPDGDIERDFMCKTVRSRYFWGDDFAAVDLSFDTGGTMRLLLPDEGVSPEDVMRNGAALDFLTKAAVPDSVESRTLEIHLSLPKFDVSGNGDISGRLMGLGVTDVFDPDSADFTPLIGEDNIFIASGEPEPWCVWVSQVLHGARVSVDEEGCEAAAYTLITLDGAGAALPEDVDEIELDLDRPFLFSVISGGVPMFAGVVNEP